MKSLFRFLLESLEGALAAIAPTLYVFLAFAGVMVLLYAVSLTPTGAAPRKQDPWLPAGAAVTHELGPGWRVFRVGDRSFLQHLTESGEAIAPWNPTTPEKP